MTLHLATPATLLPFALTASHQVFAWIESCCLCHTSPRRPCTAVVATSTHSCNSCADPHFAPGRRPPLGAYGHPTHPVLHLGTTFAPTHHDCYSRLRQSHHRVSETFSRFRQAIDGPFDTTGSCASIQNVHAS